MDVVGIRRRARLLVGSSYWTELSYLFLSPRYFPRIKEEILKKIFIFIVLNNNIVVNFLTVLNFINEKIPKKILPSSITNKLQIRLSLHCSNHTSPHNVSPILEPQSTFRSKEIVHLPIQSFFNVEYIRTQPKKYSSADTHTHTHTLRGLAAPLHGFHHFEFLGISAAVVTGGGDRVRFAISFSTLRRHPPSKHESSPPSSSREEEESFGEEVAFDRSPLIADSLSLSAGTEIYIYIYI